jgi:acetoin utilization deacetylase AcuC-like enzyme
VVNALIDLQPNLIGFAAGFDTHRFDDGAQPAGIGALTCKDQAALARWLRKALPDVPMLVAQEGGYGVQGRGAGTLPRSVYALVSSSTHGACFLGASPLLIRGRS